MLAELTLLVLILSNIIIFFTVKQEKKKMRILSLFIAGIIYNKKIKNYREVLDAISGQFEKDFCMKLFDDFIKNDRNLFYDKDLANNGFNRMYYDFYNKQFKEWYILKNSNSAGLKTHAELEDVGEKLIYKDIISGKFKDFTKYIPDDPRYFFNYLNNKEVDDIEKVLNAEWIKKREEMFKKREKKLSENHKNHIAINITEEEIYKEFNKWIKNNPSNFDKEYLAQIKLEIVNLEVKNDLCDLTYKFKGFNYEDDRRENTKSSSCDADGFAMSLYYEIVIRSDLMRKDKKTAKLIDKAGEEAREALKRVRGEDKSRHIGDFRIIWGEQKRILKEKYNIDWKTPTERNPDCKFD